MSYYLYENSTELALTFRIAVTSIDSNFNSIDLNFSRATCANVKSNKSSLLSVFYTFSYTGERQKYTFTRIYIRTEKGTNL